jgi:hypothetical protein
MYHHPTCAYFFLPPTLPSTAAATNWHREDMNPLLSILMASLFISPTPSYVSLPFQGAIL